MKTKNLLILVAIIIAGFLKSQEAVNFNHPEIGLLIGKSVYIYTDKTNTLTLKDVMLQNNFVKSNDDVPNMGVSKNTFWLKYDIKNNSNQENLLMEFSQPFVNEIVLYSEEEGKYNVQFSGDNYPFFYRKYNYPNFVFDLKIPLGETKTFYMKVRGDEQVLLPIKIGTPTTIINGLHNLDLILGLYSGIIFAMLFYNLFIYFTVRDKIYLKYVIYIFFIGFTQACILGYPFQYLWPNSPQFANLSIYLFSCAVSITSLEFLKPFLNTKVNAPRLHKFSYLITGLYILAAILSISGVMDIAYLMVQGWAGLVAFYMLVVAVYLSSKGHKPAIFFLVAWSAMLVGIIIFILKDFGLLPTNSLTSFTMPIGSALETILLSFALADRINTLKKEKELSQAEALYVSQQNQKLITEQNIILEQKVHERTIELEETNEELNVTLSYLKDTQTQLVNAEKMASLGQLTAGIAHEINNPINFVSANLKPLKTDISEVFDVVKKYEEVKPGDDVEQKLGEIDRFKKKIDLDYLKKEIATLLNGIEDGARRTSEIVSGLKNFSRLDESDIKEANINEGIDSTIVLIRSTIPRNVELVTNYQNLPLIECYPGKLNQVFMNILTNAIYAVKQKGEGEHKITVSTFMMDDKVCTTFEDSGVGMTKEVREKIFEPFFTTKDVGEGTGLGMSIVFKIVESHHAKLEIESEPGKGTKITLILNQKLN
ncbi:MAG: GHKL domain-containing protein [Bacteroidia bacterium]|nr:GHKL domain-containing protein [Bacteroidia bacterium]